MPASSTGWDRSAAAWLDEIGSDGDWARRYVLDGVMLARVSAGRHRTALDVGCGEGRFCRMMRPLGISVVGLDPTAALIAEARRRDPTGEYVLGVAEDLPFKENKFDLVVSYLLLIDVADHRTAIAEMARVLRPGGTLLIANLTSFNTAASRAGWVRDGDGMPEQFPIDHYLDERAEEVAWRDIAITNWHRPLAAYMQPLLQAGLRMTFFDEPAPEGYPDENAEKADRYRRVPYFLVMEWQKPLKGETDV